MYFFQDYNSQDDNLQFYIKTHINFENQVTKMIYFIPIYNAFEMWL